MSTPFGLRHRQDGGIATIILAGEIDLAVIDAVATGVTAQLDRPDVTGIDIDLTEVGFLDSSGISVLIRLRSSAEAAGKSFGMYGATGIVDTVLAISGVGEFLHVRSSA